MNVNVGDMIRWTSRSGVMTGKVTKIKIAPNAAGQSIPWMLVEDVENWIGRPRESQALYRATHRVGV